jgi:hypothetical protein
MKDAFAVLEQKEADLARVRLEIESLTIVASLLEKTEDSPELKATGTDGPFSSLATTRSTLWKALKRAR